jgi:hypothetical protein
MSKDIKPDTFVDHKKGRINPALAVLPPFLKDPDNYEKIQRALLDAGATKHSHGEVVDWAGCKECQGKQIDRLNMMKKLGFTSAAQYKAWQKIHEQIKDLKRMPLEKYNS